MTKSYAQFGAEHDGWLRALLGPERYSTGESQLDLHSKDTSGHTPRRPAAVAWPESVEEVRSILAYAQEQRLPVTPWGAGTSLEGNPIPLYGGVCLDMTCMDRVLALRVEDFQADVQPGVIYQDLNEKLRSHGLFLPPDPGARATIGGMIANNASGTRTVKYGATRPHVLRLDVVLPGGELLRLGSRASKTASAYDLKDLFVGSEGTLGVIVEATVKLVGYPEAFSAAVAPFPSVEAAARSVFEIMRGGLDPAALELIDSKIMELIGSASGMNLAPAPTLFMEFHGTDDRHLKHTLELAEELCRTNGATDFAAGVGRDERDRLWHARHTVGEAVIRSHPGCFPVSADIAVPISTYAEIIAFCRSELAKLQLPGYIFSHAGDGNVHVVFMPKADDAEEKAIVARVYGLIVEKAIEAGGTATGEHGVGIGKIEFMEREHGAGIAWMRKIKELFDPFNILNPGKIFKVLNNAP